MTGHKRRSRNGELTPAALDQMLDTEIRTRMHFIHRLEESPVEKVLRTGEVLGPLRFADQEARCQYLETVWSTGELQQEFEVLGFMAPFVVVRRKSDGQKGSLMFQHDPRYYFSFQEDR